MALNYGTRLSNLQQRKYDSILKESVTAKAFFSKDLPDDVKYLLESMRAIDKKYNDRTLLASERVMTHLEGKFNLHFTRAYKRQGSVETQTNIKAHSDVDLLTMIDRYVYLAPGLPITNPYTASDPDTDIKELRQQAHRILADIYQEVDGTNDKCISIVNKDLNRKVDVVFAFWYNTINYERTNDETHRGIKIGSSLAAADYPFAHIQSVNQKGDRTLDGSRKAIRLLKTLRADSEKELKLVKSFEITTLVHAMEDRLLTYSSHNELQIAQAVSGQLNLLISHPHYRSSIKSPNGYEQPLGAEAMVPELVRLKADLDELITDASTDILASKSVKNAILTY